MYSRKLNGSYYEYILFSLPYLEKCPRTCCRDIKRLS